MDIWKSKEIRISQSGFVRGKSGLFIFINMTEYFEALRKKMIYVMQTLFMWIAFD